MTRQWTKNGGCRVRTLQQMSCSVVTGTVHLSVDLLSELPAPVVEDLAIALCPAQLLKLEEALNTQTLTKKAWKQHCINQRYTADDHKSQRCKHNETVWRSSVVSCYRDLWIKSYVSMYLLQHFNMWKPQQPETHARAFLFSGLMNQSIEEFPVLLFEDFLCHTARMMGLVKELSIRSHTLSKLTQHPPIIQALKNNLLALKVDFLRKKNFPDMIRVVKELMSDGRLRSLSLINVCHLFDDWHQLFFVASGAFSCKLCSLGTDMDHRAETVTGFGSCYSNRDMKAECGTEKEAETECRPIDQKTLFSGTDQCLRLKKPCSSDMFLKSGVSVSVPYQAENLSCRTEVGGCEHTISKHSQSCGLPSRCVSGVVKKKVHSSSVDKHVLPDVPDTHIATARSSHSASVTHDKYCACTDCVHCGAGTAVGDGMEIADIYDMDQPQDGEADRSASRRNSAEQGSLLEESTEEEDLLNEALGVSSFLQSTPPGTSGCLHDSVSSVCPSGSAKLCVAEVESIHTAERYSIHGIKDLSLTSLWSAGHGHRCSQTLAMLLGLQDSLPSWTALSSISLDMAFCPCLSTELKDVLQILTEKADRRSLRSVSISVHQEDRSVQDGSDFLVLEQFFWKILYGLSSSAVKCNDAQPMQLLQINVVGEPITFREKSVDIPEGRCWRGLEELSLSGVRFEGWQSLAPLAGYITCDVVLSHLSLQHCALDAASARCLFTALTGRDQKSIKHIDLRGSVREVTEDVWDDVCCVVHHLQSLMYLCLADCRLTPFQVRSSQFVSAVTRHSSARDLTLDLSDNLLGDSVWEFMSDAMGPGSSLNGLHFVRTGCGLSRGLSIMKTRHENCADDQLPLLHCCCFTASLGDSVAKELVGVLHQMVEKVHTYSCSVSEEHLAVM